MRHGGRLAGRRRGRDVLGEGRGCPSLPGLCHGGRPRHHRGCGVGSPTCSPGRTAGFQLTLFVRITLNRPRCTELFSESRTPAERLCAAALRARAALRTAWCRRPHRHSPLPAPATQGGQLGRPGTRAEVPQAQAGRHGVGDRQRRQAVRPRGWRACGRRTTHGWLIGRAVLHPGMAIRAGSAGCGDAATAAARAGR